MELESLLLVFVKFPEPGRVKTRLAVDVGPEKAAEIYRQMVRAVLDSLPSGQRVRILYDSFRPESDYRAWLDHPALADAEFSSQSEGNLGNRLTAAFANAFRDGWRKVGVIGSDCVDITPEIYAEAWATLETHDVVIGPTFDGGYYFLASRLEVPSLFSGIAWSSELVYEQTLAAARAADWTLTPLKKLHDIDTLDDWKRSSLSRVGRDSPASFIHRGNSLELD